MDKILNKKKIILIISGGIAAYKSLDLIRLLKKQECEIKVVLTESGKNLLHLYQLHHYLKIKSTKIFLIARMKQKWITYHYRGGVI